MSFLKSVGNFVSDAAKEAANDVMRKQESIQRHMERLERLSDEELIRKMNSSSGEIKLACIQLLKERGYGG